LTKKKQKVVSRLAREILKIYRLIFVENNDENVDLNKSALRADVIMQQDIDRTRFQFLEIYCIEIKLSYNTINFFIEIDLEISKLYL